MICCFVTRLPSLPLISLCSSLLLRFAHVFSETGKYVFVDNAVPEWSVVVVVTEEGTECNPRASVFQPMTPTQLVKYGIIKQHRLNLLPDWGLIVGVYPSILLACLQ